MVEPTINTDNTEFEQLNNLIYSMADGVIAVSNIGKVIAYNGSALNLLNINNTIVGQNIDAVLHVVDNKGEALDIKKYILDAKVPITDRNHRINYPDNSFIHLYISVAPIRLGFGKKGIEGFVVLLRDITVEKSLEEERNEFISVISHELGNPIAIAEGSLGNALHATQKTEGIDNIKSALKLAHDQVLFLSDMINDLSTLSRAERGTLQVEVDSINVHDLLKSLETNYTDQANTKGLKFSVEIDPRLELLQSSKLYVREILQNFITNAIKYTNSGSITVGANKINDGVEFFVTDTGFGISTADQAKVWQKFYRSEDYRTRQNNGTGLGLYVTMKLARLIHADIKLKSELNVGSTFDISIPDIQQQPVV